MFHLMAEHRKAIEGTWASQNQRHELLTGSYVS